MDYSALVVGAGPGGYVCAIRMAQLGLKVAVIEKGEVGGTCTNRGCIPTKALLYPVHIHHEMVEKGGRMGLKFEDISLDIEKMAEHMKRSVMKSRKGIEYLLRKNGVDLIKAEALLKSRNVVELRGDSRKSLSANRVVVATGSKPKIPHMFSEIDGLWTSDDFFENFPTIPSSILIIGGGVVGIEIGTILSVLGSKVTIVELMDHVLPNEDEDVADLVKRSLMKIGVQFFESSKVVKVDRNGEGSFTVTMDGKEERFEMNFERILLAVGREAVLDDGTRDILDLKDGFVETDETMRTKVEGIYAVGDVNGKSMLAHTAFMEGITAAENVAGRNARMDYSAIPKVLFSILEVASVGMGEKDVKGKGNYKVSKFPLTATGRAFTLDERYGFAKVITDEDDVVVGMSIVGPNASEMIMEGVIAVKKGMKVHELSRLVHPHPTLSEMVLGAFEVAEGRAIHI